MGVLKTSILGKGRRSNVYLAFSWRHLVRYSFYAASLTQALIKLAKILHDAVTFFVRQVRMLTLRFGGCTSEYSDRGGGEVDRCPPPFPLKMISATWTPSGFLFRWGYCLPVSRRRWKTTTFWTRCRLKPYGYEYRVNGTTVSFWKRLVFGEKKAGRIFPGRISTDQNHDGGRAKKCSVCVCFHDFISVAV